MSNIEVIKNTVVETRTEYEKIKGQLPEQLVAEVTENEQHYEAAFSASSEQFEAMANIYIQSMSKAIRKTKTYTERYEMVKGIYKKSMRLAIPFGIFPNLFLSALLFTLTFQPAIARLFEDVDSTDQVGNIIRVLLSAATLILTLYFTGFPTACGFVLRQNNSYFGGLGLGLANMLFGTLALSSVGSIVFFMCFGIFIIAFNHLKAYIKDYKAFLKIYRSLDVLKEASKLEQEGQLKQFDENFEKVLDKYDV